MPARWSFEAHVPAPPDAVFAWMSDYAPDDHANERFQRGAGVKADDRTHNHRVVARKDARHLVVRDEWGRRRFELQVELAPEAREIRLAGQMGYRGVWRAAPDGAGGTRVTSEGALEPRGALRLFAPLFAGAFVRQMKQDFDGHVADMRESLPK
jgi:hypothetical protein